jgi:16S rRNA (guanine527-N7)-methyltransferase
MASIGAAPAFEQPLERGLRALDLRLGRDQLDACFWLAAELLDWNRQLNLTAITDPFEVQIKHILDSLTLVPLLDRLLGDRGGYIVDVGSGPGFPALPLSIVRPSLEVVLLEATGKKVAFLEHVIQGLGLDRVRAIHGRAELVARDPDFRESFDLAVARGVGHAPSLAELLLPLVQVGRWSVLMKTHSGLDEELAEASPAIEALGGRVQEIVRADLPGLLEDRALVVLKKIAATPLQFPRRPGIPQRRPLTRRAKGA